MDSATQFNSATETGTMQLIKKKSKSVICCCNWVVWRYVCMEEEGDAQGFSGGRVLGFFGSLWPLLQGVQPVTTAAAVQVRAHRAGFGVYKLSIGAACGLSWPLDCLIIQVLDDSTDPEIKGYDGIPKEIPDPDAKSQKIGMRKKMVNEQLQPSQTLNTRDPGNKRKQILNEENNNLSGYVDQLAQNSENPTIL
ncbi:hypothetical protein Cni_G22713 [Canna indica]|uniref:Uncharacterized protein n=1 Tax=Canna indica TaxID=4628 RepID=A0AAQ3QLF7_9LILI|nr:hypothetical protein Cni_G22713 [Canna indica]